MAASLPHEKGTFKTPDGAVLAYRILGSQHEATIPLIMITGMSATMDDWSPLVEELGKKRTVLIMDHRGMGESRLAEGWDGSISLTMLGIDALSVISSLGSRFSKINLLGWSMGGLISQVILTLPEAKEHPQGGLEVMGVHIVNVILSATMTKLPRGDFKPNKMEPVMQKAMTAKSQQEGKRIITTAMMEYQYDPQFLSQNRSLLNSRVDVSMNTRRPQALIMQQVEAITNTDVRSQLYKIPKSLNVLVIHGEKDRMVAYSESEEIVSRISHAKRVDICGREASHSHYGHFWFDYFGAEQWASEIEAFLDKDNSHDARPKL